MSVSLEEVARLVEALPPGAREQLARGPMPDPMCRLCSVLRNDCEAAPRETVSRLWDGWHLEHHDLIGRAFTGTLVEGDPDEKKLGAFEAALDTLEAERGRDNPVSQTYRELAGALSFYRCVCVYVLAGWQP